MKSNILNDYVIEYKDGKKELVKGLYKGNRIRNCPVCGKPKRKEIKNHYHIGE